MSAPTDHSPTDAKIRRARAHVCELEDKAKSFLASGPFEVARRVDPETHEAVYYAARVREVPLEIAVITADVLRNLRASLDQLACALVIAGGNYPTRNTGFPVFASLGLQRQSRRESSRYGTKRNRPNRRHEAVQGRKRRTLATRRTEQNRQAPSTSDSGADAPLSKRYAECHSIPSQDLGRSPRCMASTRGSTRVIDRTRKAALPDHQSRCHFP